MYYQAISTIKVTNFRNVLKNNFLENSCIIVHPLSHHNTLPVCVSIIKLPHISTLLPQPGRIMENDLATKLTSVVTL